MSAVSLPSEPDFLLPENTTPTAYLESVKGLSAPLAHNRAILDRKYGKDWRENEALLTPLEFHAAYSKPSIGNRRGTTKEQSDADHQVVVEWALSVGRPANPESLKAYGLAAKPALTSDEAIVYHGSKEPISEFDASKQQSGYYPGFYTTTHRQSAECHGMNIVAFKIRVSEFYEVRTAVADDLKREAAAKNYRISQGSGFGEAEYLKDAGYAGIRRGSEFILFSPETQQRVDPDSTVPLVLPVVAEAPAVAFNRIR